MKKGIKRDLKKYVPLRELHFYIGKKTGEEPKGYVTKDALIQKLETLAEENKELLKEIDELVIKYRFAGRGSISWSIPIKKTKLTKKDVEETIKKNSGDDIFENELKPQITNEPTLNRAEWLREDLLKLEFVFADKTYILEENYEIKEISPTRRAAVLIRFLNSPFVIESRANYRDSIHLHRIISQMLEVDTIMFKFTNLEIVTLKNSLGAKKKAARHKKAAGDFDTVEVSARPLLDDLDSSNEYLNLLGSDEMRKGRYQFNYTTNDGENLKVSYYISKKGSIWFLSEVPEEVVEHVFSCIRNVKNL